MLRIAVVRENELTGATDVVFMEDARANIVAASAGWVPGVKHLRRRRVNRKLDEVVARLAQRTTELS